MPEASNEDEPTHPALAAADEEIARLEAMTPEQVADYIDGKEHLDSDGSA